MHEKKDKLITELSIYRIILRILHLWAMNGFRSKLVPFLLSVTNTLAYYNIRNVLQSRPPVEQIQTAAAWLSCSLSVPFFTQILSTPGNCGDTKDQNFKAYKGRNKSHVVVSQSVCCNRSIQSESNIVLKAVKIYSGWSPIRGFHLGRLQLCLVERTGIVKHSSLRKKF